MMVTVICACRGGPPAPRQAPHRPLRPRRLCRRPLRAQRPLRRHPLLRLRVSDDTLRNVGVGQSAGSPGRP